MSPDVVEVGKDEEENLRAVVKMLEELDLSAGSEVMKLPSWDEVHNPDRTADVVQMYVFYPQ